MTNLPNKSDNVHLWMEIIGNLREVQQSRGKYENTSIELSLQNQLNKEGVDFYTQVPLLGLPDIFIKPDICIFADGCYFHGCLKCPSGVKYRGRRKKDAFNTRTLEESGFKVFRFWEHEIKASPEKCIKKVMKYINGN